MPQVHIDLVIARYEEDISWIHKTIADLNALNYEVTIFVYNKGSECKTAFDVVQLPNVGRESHTYLNHIITQYERYKSDPAQHYVVFLQAGFIDHSFTFYRGYNTQTELVMAFVNDALKYGASISWAKPHEELQGLSAHWHFRIAMHNQKPLHPLVGRPFGEWFTENVSPNFNRDMLLDWWIAALFCVSSKMLIESHDKDYYVNLVNKLTDLDPEVGHFFERSWVYITGADQAIVNYRNNMYLKRNGKLL